jgi:hypothetical protein
MVEPPPRSSTITVVPSLVANWAAVPLATRSVVEPDAKGTTILMVGGMTAGCATAAGAVARQAIVVIETKNDLNMGTSGIVSR